MDRKRISRVFFFEGLACGLFWANIVFAVIQIANAHWNDKNWWSEESILLLPIVLAAYVTLRGVAEQARSAQDIDSERIERAERAKRARLSDALSVLDEHAKKMLAWHHSPKQHHVVDWRPISDALSVLSDVIEFSDNETGNQLASIIAMHQISRSRYSEHQFELDQDITFLLIDLHFKNSFHCNCTIRWAAIKRGVASCYEYARYDSSRISTIVLQRDEVASEIAQAHPTRVLFDLEDTEFDLLNNVLDVEFSDGGVPLARFHKRRA